VSFCSPIGRESKNEEKNEKSERAWGSVPRASQW
jgi:hypothetical protein